LNACNFSIIHFIIKLNDHNIDLFKIKHVFKNNSLIIELNFSTFMKIHLIFHVTFLNHIASDFLSNQHQKSEELIIIENDERFWYVNSILNFKHNKHYNLSLLKYYINWKNHFFTWKSFHFLNNYELELINIISSTLSSKNHMYCHMWCLNINVKNFKFNLHHFNSILIWLRFCLNLTQM